MNAKQRASNLEGQVRLLQAGMPTAGLVSEFPAAKAAADQLNRGAARAGPAPRAWCPSSPLSQPCLAVQSVRSRVASALLAWLAKPVSGAARLACEAPHLLLQGPASQPRPPN